MTASDVTVRGQSIWTSVTVAARGLRYETRLVLGKPIVASMVIGITVAALSGRTDDTDLRMSGLRLALAMAAIGVAFSLDDAAQHITAAVPQPLRYRRMQRVVPIAIIWTLTVAIIDWIGWATETGATLLPLDRYSLEATAQVTAQLALAATFARREVEQPGRLAASAFLGMLLISWLIPGPMRPWIRPDSPHWEVGYRVWSIVLAAGLLMLVSSSWDARNGRSFRIPVQ